MGDDHKVVGLNGNDVPAMLRNLADLIERGEYDEVEAVLVLMPRPGDYPKIFGFGDQHGANEPSMLCEMAKLWLLQNMVARA